MKHLVGERLLRTGLGLFVALGLAACGDDGETKPQAAPVVPTVASQPGDRAASNAERSHLLSIGRQIAERYATAKPEDRDTVSNNGLDVVVRAAGACTVRLEVDSTAPLTMPTNNTAPRIASVDYVAANVECKGKDPLRISGTIESDGSLVTYWEQGKVQVATGRGETGAVGMSPAPGPNSGTNIQDQILTQLNSIAATPNGGTLPPLTPPHG